MRTQPTGQLAKGQRGFSWVLPTAPNTHAVKPGLDATQSQVRKCISPRWSIRSMALNRILHTRPKSSPQHDAPEADSYPKNKSCSWEKKDGLTCLSIYAAICFVPNMEINVSTVSLELDKLT